MPRDRVDTFVLRSLMNLPVRVQRVLAGRSVVLDGQRLAPETQLMLRLHDLARLPHIEDLPLAQARTALVDQARLVGGDQLVGSVRDLSVDGAAGALPARLYTPTERLGALPAPTLLFVHGGGMMYGDLDSHDAACRHLAEQSGVQLLAIDYRLAPENPFPAAVEDCAAAYRWLLANAESVGADRERLAVGGDSAGGYLSATTAVIAAQEGLPLAFQLLVYPVTDFTTRSRSRELFGEGFFLTTAFMDGTQAAYFPPGTDLSDPRASVLKTRDFPEGLARALVITAGYDPLRDEGEAYARLLHQHGVRVEQIRYPSMIHGFFNAVGCGHQAPSYNRRIAAKLRAALG
ncbi:MAG: alpha/beta hydrolase [Actinomycetota bacterium]|nr:alpha/beta hydrolase [Actinomycetota bacterium]